MAKIKGTNGNDTLVGTAGDDTITPLLGNDTVNGGAGFDTLIVDYTGLHEDESFGSAISLNASGSWAGALRGGFYNGHEVTFANIEKLVFTGTDSDESFEVDFGTTIVAADRLTLDGGAGNDFLSLDFSGLATATTFTVSGATATSNRGTFTNWEWYRVELGAVAGSVIQLGAGDDIVLGGTAAATISGGAGNDTVGSYAADIFDGGAGDKDYWGAYYQSTTAGLSYLQSGTHMSVSNGALIDNVEEIQIFCGSGNDIGATNGGDFIFIGKDGIDMLTVDYAGQVPTAALTTSEITYDDGYFGEILGAGTSDAYFYGIEKLTVTTGDGADLVKITLDKAPAAGTTLAVSGGLGSDTLAFDASAIANNCFFIEMPGQVFTVASFQFSGFETLDLKLGIGADYVLATSTRIIASGSLGDDLLFGGTMDDVLSGDEGDDRISGGAGNDVLAGGLGFDMVSYADAAGGVTVSLAISTAQNTGGAGIDTLSGFEKLIGSNFDDTLTGGGYDDVLAGGLGKNTLKGGTGSDAVDYSTASAGVVVDLGIAGFQNTVGAGIDRLISIEDVFGSGYDDLIAGNAGDNILMGGAGNNTVSYASATAGVTIDLVRIDAQETGGAGRDTLRWFQNVIGSAFDDVLSGDANDNIFTGGAGNDTYYGSGGNDTVSWVDAEAGVTVTLGGRLVQSSGGGGIDTLYSIENLTGSAFADVLTGDSGANVLKGGAGNDRLNGGAGADTICGGAGNDVLIGGGGVDTVSYADATAGVTVSLASTSQQGTGGGGNDTLNGFENLTGSAFADTLTGTAGVNVLTGGAADDTLLGGGGNDTFDGGEGTDTASFVDAASGVTLNLGVVGAQASGVGSVRLTGIENLIGSAFDDTLTGSRGDNVLTGGGGADTLTGGLGADRFMFTSIADAPIGRSADTITDFRRGQGDLIDLSGIDAVAGGPANEAFSFLGTGAFTGHAGELRVVASPAAGGLSTVYGDVTGDGVADFMIQVVSAQPLNAADFVL